MKILLVGDIVGSPGRRAFARIVGRMRQEQEVDFVVANAENAAGGKGLTPDTGEELLSAGADVLTLGDHTWDQKEILPYLDRETRLVRPANFAPGCPGRGFTTVSTPFGPVTVVCLVGRVFMSPSDCPFRTVDKILKERECAGRLIIVDIHAEATSEKIVLGRYLDGRVSCVFGTHTHVQTSDEAILPKGTAYITDVGMTGARDSAIGRDLKSVTEMFLTGMPAKFKLAQDQIALEGLLAEVDPDTGRARKVKRVREPFD
ncbi:MAG: TIGR00282 family metallophosphoesterase [Kiritimatiellae bacterium]|nr:TIGR00282 family metallophosphoesterase [Kiritimatiellia bacterium]